MMPDELAALKRLLFDTAFKVHDLSGELIPQGPTWCW